MMPDLYWIQGIPNVRLAVMPRPRNGEWLADEIAGWKLAGLNIVVSLLEDHEIRDLELGEEPALCRAHGMTFISLPVVDRGIPCCIHQTAELVDRLASDLTKGLAVGIHCRAGIGRSALLAACVMTRLGISASETFPLISQARGVSCPDTEAQINWLSFFARESQRHYCP